MPRPCKQRRICAMPDCAHFGPQSGDGSGRQTIRMSLDEFESIRLIDLENMTQEQCAVQMNVARTTAQAIYNSARSKLAECLVHEKELRIEGGDYVICNGAAELCGCGFRGKKHCPRSHFAEGQLDGGKLNMKIAVTYENGQIFQHFGHTEQFKLYDIANNAVVAATVVSTNGSGHGALAQILAEQHVDTLICGGIGAGAQQALATAGIKLFGGASGDADEAVAALLRGELAYNPNVQCNHHGEHHGGTCGEHGCGEHHGDHKGNA